MERRLEGISNRDVLDSGENDSFRCTVYIRDEGEGYGHTPDITDGAAYPSLPSLAA